MNYLQEIGPLAIASRLKSLSELLMTDMIKIYRSQHIEFEPRWFSFVHLIHHRGPLQITHIARELNQSHPAANQVANALEKKGYVVTTRDKMDSRRRIISLSPQGKALVIELEPIWKAVELSVRELLSETCPGFFDCIHAIEEQLRKKPMRRRIVKQLAENGKNVIDIIDYHPDLKNDFRSLNEEWLNQYFEVEPEDRRLLDNPGPEIIDCGGHIVFARNGQAIIGTGAVIKVDNHTCELTKMAVTPGWQGNQVGRKILWRLIRDAKKMKFRKMILLTSEKLNKAVSLYRSEGFIQSDTGTALKHNFKRCSIQMELDLAKIKLKNDTL